MIVHRPALLRERPACVLLDLDNTLYDYAPCNTAGMNAAADLAMSRLDMSHGQFLLGFDKARAEVKARIGTQAASHSRLLYFQGMLERGGFAGQAYLALQLEQTFWRAYLDEARLFDDAYEFLDDLRTAGTPMVVVTDQLTRIQMRKLMVLGLDTVLDRLVTSEESGQDKPAAVNFELALAKAGRPGGPVWMIGDHAGRDMEGAKRAVNAVTLHKTEGRQGAPANAAIDASFHDFADLRALWAGLALEPAAQAGAGR